jgi:hypothetical protein
LNAKVLFGTNSRGHAYQYQTVSFLFRKIAKRQHRFNAFGENFPSFSKTESQISPFIFLGSLSSQVCLSTCTLLIVLYKSVATQVEIRRGNLPLLPHYKIEKEKD